jgi:hypothetical protein
MANGLAARWLLPPPPFWLIMESKLFIANSFPVSFGDGRTEAMSVLSIYVEHDHHTKPPDIPASPAGAKLLAQNPSRVWG